MFETTVPFQKSKNTVFPKEQSHYILNMSRISRSDAAISTENGKQNVHDVYCCKNMGNRKASERRIVMNKSTVVK